MLSDRLGRGSATHKADTLLPEAASIDGLRPRQTNELIESTNYMFIADDFRIAAIMPLVQAVLARHSAWQLHCSVQAFLLCPCSDKSRWGREIPLIYIRATSLGQSTSDAFYANPAPRRLIYCCGFGPLKRAVLKHGAAWPSGSLIIQRYSPRPQLPGNPHDGTAPTSRCRRSMAVRCSPTEFETLASTSHVQRRRSP